MKAMYKNVHYVGVRRSMKARNANCTLVTPNVSRFIWDTYLVPWLENIGAVLKKGEKLLMVSVDSVIITNRDLLRETEALPDMTFFLEYETLERLLKYSGE